jgi:hypothetical protein
LVVSPPRPYLAAALAALTDDSEEDWSPKSRRVTALMPSSIHYRWPPKGMGVDGKTGWAIADPKTALETLCTVGVLPGSWCSGDDRSFWVVTATGDRIGIRTVESVESLPASVGDLVAWAALGTKAILRAEELARETVAAIRRTVGKTRHEVNGRPVWAVARRRSVGSVVWHDGGSWMMPNMTADGMLALNSGSATKVSAAHDLWVMGLCIERITADGITISMPYVGSP